MAPETVVAFAGHMIDSPDRCQPRFSPESVPRVALVIKDELARLNAVAGVSSGASGSDILFAEAILDRGSQLHLIFPLNIEEFLETSVRPSQDPSWERRFHQIRKAATTEQVCGDDYVRHTGTPFQLVALLIDGEAQIIARSPERAAAALCVWDGGSGDGLGGAASFVGHCYQRGRNITAIHPLTGAVSKPGSESLVAAQKHSWRTLQADETTLEHRLAAFLFADAKGFSGLDEAQMPAFIRVMLGVIRSAIAEMSVPPLVVNTWGDGLLVCTETPGQAARLALGLLERAGQVKPKVEGLRGNLNFRIGLHAGPAFVTKVDPVTGQANVYGRDVSIAARIEPVVEVGKAWGSRVFETLAAATDDAGLAFRDLGEVPLAKGAGTLHLKELSWAPVAHC